MPIKCLVLAELTLSIQAPTCAPQMTSFGGQDAVESTMLDMNAKSPEYSDSIEDLKLTDYSISEFFMYKVQSILDNISKLSDNWDGYGAMPISEAAINNVKAIGKAMFNWDFSKWQITPSVNGDIYINYKGKDKLAGFLIGDELFTYFIEENGQLSGQENHAFDARVVVNLASKA